MMIIDIFTPILPSIAAAGMLILKGDYNYENRHRSA